MPSLQYYSLPHFGHFIIIPFGTTKIIKNYGVHESTIYRIIKWVENTLIKDGTFSLPGKKALLKSNIDYEVVLIDVAESPIERPKKNSEITTQARKINIP